ncbi:hypothetical protein SEEACDC2_00095, partial [Salmonella enterica subsp. enterica serovar Agona str. SA-2]
ESVSVLSPDFTTWPLPLMALSNVARCSAPAWRYR